MNKMKRKNKFFRFAAAILSLTMFVSASACSKSSESSQGGSPQGSAQSAQQNGKGGNAPKMLGVATGKILIIGKNSNVSFWEEVRKGAEDAGSELGCTVEYQCATGDNDFSSQVGFINSAIANDFDAIVVAPNSTTELNSAFQRAEEAGISIININSKADYEGVRSVISSSDTTVGKTAARQAANLLTEEKGGLTGNGKIGIIQHTAETGKSRADAFKEAFSSKLSKAIGASSPANSAPTKSEEAAEETEEAATPPANGEENDKTAEGGSETSSTPANTAANNSSDAVISNYFVEAEPSASESDAHDKALKMLQDKDNSIKIMFGTNTNTTLGICQAVEELDLADDVIVIGMNSDERELSYIRTGVLDGTIIQNPYIMGYISIRFAQSLIGGTYVPPALDTGVTYVNASNINDEYIQLLLYPDKY